MEKIEAKQEELGSLYQISQGADSPEMEIKQNSKDFSKEIGRAHV